MIKKRFNFMFKVVYLTLTILIITAFIPLRIYEYLMKMPLIGGYFPLLITGILALFIIYEIFGTFKDRIKTKKNRNDRVTEQNGNGLQKDKKMIGTRRIVQFFLKIYKFQLGEDLDALSQIKPLDSRTIAPKERYELKVAKKRAWKSRNMTVGTIGEESGSRSQCYSAIFDDHLVIKIPPKPITDFKTYINTIIADQKIVNRLAPRECLVPSVSAVMKLIHPIANSKSLPHIELEKKYYNWLINYPGFQEYLKIDKSFVFIMDLSKYFFLGDTLKDIHNLKTKVQQEIIHNPDVIWETYGFEGRYEFDNSTLIESIRKLYDTFKNNVEKFQTKSGYSESIPRFTLQKWFLLHLANKKIKSKEKNINPEFIDKLNRLLGKLLKKNQEIVEKYRQIITLSVQKTTVKQHQPQMETLITNLLDLLSWLKKRDVAIRDLKPDNLLIAGERSRYPDFLNSCNDYSVGLIDVETAVHYNPDGNKNVAQPILGGTPSYSTPSHLFLNKLLDQFFKDYKRILYLQDWFATLAMIYETVTGAYLFMQSGKLIIGIKEQMLETRGGVKALFNVFKHSSRMFWLSINVELHRKIKIKKDMLESVRVSLPDHVKAMFSEEFLIEKKEIEIKLKKTIQSQEIFNGKKNCQDLYCASCKNITKLKNYWIKNKNISRGQQNRRVLAINLFQDLEKLKYRIEKIEKLIKVFNTYELNLSAYALIGIMFDIIFNAMYKSEWGSLSGIEIDNKTDQTDATSYEATI